MNTLTAPFSLNGHSISLIGLPPETEFQLHRLGISTLEQLARLAMNSSGVDECQAIEAIQKELTARLAPRPVSCLCTSGFAVHFVIHAENLFFFKASVIPDDEESWTCTYQWYGQTAHVGSGDTMMFFHEPSSPSESLVSEHHDLTPRFDRLSAPLQISHPSAYLAMNMCEMKTDKRIQDAPANHPQTQQPDLLPLTGEKVQKSTIDTHHTPPVMQPVQPVWDDYDTWNHAIATHMTAGAQYGSIIYLCIDDEVIKQITQRLSAQAEHPPKPFLEAVRQRVVQRRRIELKRIRGRNKYGEPNCIAFLAAMVLAASRMAEDEEEDISSSNYFTRFCEVLQLEQENGRPPGMKFGAEDEEPLWREWTIWLGEQGLISSARPGEGARRYTNYPISQTLLRGADRDRLYRLFQEGNWPDDWNSDTVLAEVQRAAPYLTKHLQHLLSDASQRAHAIAEAIYDAYEAWASGDIDGQTSHRSRQHYLIAGIWRREDALSGTIEYFLYPRAPRRQQFDEIIVDIDNQQHTLMTERPGWYMPLCSVNEQLLNQGVRYPVIQPSELNALILPSRAFWVLRPDPDNPESGMYASWGRVPLGVQFILLCRRELLADLEQLRIERLIEWSGEPQPVPSFSEWMEIRNCMVISPVWDGVEIEHPDLQSALRPQERLSISLAGGLRAPKGGWLADMGPTVTVFGFPPEAEVRVIRLSDEHIIFEETQPTNQPFSVPWKTPGDYRIEITAEGKLSQSLARLVDWDQLEMAPVDDFAWPQIDQVRLCGAVFHTLDEEV
ncbi:hypothetical protein [Roseiflexus castenholzii]|uniref:hypothetical protein n=1 Tax=Roseiflexus castenholzii TaxID=120962 RepID=UPI003C7A6F43